MATEPRSTTAPRVDGELMPQRQVLEDEISAGADRSEECCDKQTEVEHRRASRGSPILCYLRTELHLSGFAVPRGLRVPAKRRKRQRLGDSAVPAVRLRAERPNHVWALDFQFDQTANGRVLKLLNIV